MVEIHASLPDGTPLARWRTHEDGTHTRIEESAISPTGSQRPKIVCLCGSTRFWQAFRDEGLRLTLQGVIVLSIGVCAPDSITFAHPDSPETRLQKARLDVLHLHKIDLADEILVLNVGGYIGESTEREIVYAESLGKPVRYLEGG